MLEHCEHWNQCSIEAILFSAPVTSNIPLFHHSEFYLDSDPRHSVTRYSSVFPRISDSG